MTETVQLPPIYSNDTEDCAPMSPEPNYTDPLLKLIHHVSYIHPDLPNRDQEMRHAIRRSDMLLIAIHSYFHGDYTTAISELKCIKHDFDIAGDGTHSTAIDDAIEQCYIRYQQSTLATSALSLITSRNNEKELL